MDIVTPEEFDEEPIRDAVPPEYRAFREGEDVPVHTGLYVEDIDALETGPWDRTGQRGAFLNLYGMQGVMDIQVHELEPEGETSRQRHVFDEIVYVTAGNGITVIGEDETTIEWSEDSLFYIPKNVPYRYVNGSDQRARLYSHTSLPYMLSGLKDVEFIYDCDHDFVDLVEGFYADRGSEGRKFEDKYEDSAGAPTWEANFIPDIMRFENLDAWDRMGSSKYVMIPFEDSIIPSGHIVEYEPGVYSKAHRHGAGANVHARGGKGYTLTWKEGWDQRIRLDWEVGSLVTPPPGWYHQHFTVERARNLAVHSPELGTLKDNQVFDPFQPNNIMEYVDEDPQIRDLYRAELDAVGGEFRMPEDVYTDPEYPIEEYV